MTHNRTYTRLIHSSVGHESNVSGFGWDQHIETIPLTCPHPTRSPHTPPRCTPKRHTDRRSMVREGEKSDNRSRDLALNDEVRDFLIKSVFILHQNKKRRESREKHVKSRLWWTERSISPTPTQEILVSYRGDKSSGIEILISEAFVKINLTEPFRLVGKQNPREICFLWGLFIMNQ